MMIAHKYNLAWRIAASLRPVWQGEVPSPPHAYKDKSTSSNTRPGQKVMRTISNTLSSFYNTVSTEKKKAREAAQLREYCLLCTKPSVWERWHRFVTQWRQEGQSSRQWELTLFITDLERQNQVGLGSSRPAWGAGDPASRGRRFLQTQRPELLSPALLTHRHICNSRPRRQRQDWAEEGSWWPPSLANQHASGSVRDPISKTVKITQRQ